MNVLITRPEPEASAFAAKCRASGLEPIIAPLMEIVVLDRKIDLSGVGALAFTSANGVRAFAANSGERDLPVFAVGEASAATASAAGFSSVAAAGGDADALTQLIAGDKKTLRGAVLHVAGTHRAGDLVEALKARGVAAGREVLYETKDASALPPEAIAALVGKAWVTLFSPRSAALFLSLAERAGLNKALARHRAACLSEAVAEMARRGDWKSVEVAAGRTSAAMIELMTNA